MTESDSVDYSRASGRERYNLRVGMEISHVPLSRLMNAIPQRSSLIPAESVEERMKTWAGIPQTDIPLALIEPDHGAVFSQQLKEWLRQQYVSLRIQRIDPERKTIAVSLLLNEHSEADRKKIRDAMQIKQEIELTFNELFGRLIFGVFRA